MRHAHIEILHSSAAAHVNDVLECRNKDFAALQAKSFLRRVLLSQEVLESEAINTVFN